MRRIGGRDNVCILEEQATDYPAEGCTHQWKRDEEVATFGFGERETPCLLEDLVAQLYWKGGAVMGVICHHR